jgi:hypothetical protein
MSRSLASDILFDSAHYSNEKEEQVGRARRSAYMAFTNLYVGNWVGRAELLVWTTLWLEDGGFSLIILDIFRTYHHPMLSNTPHILK